MTYQPSQQPRSTLSLDGAVPLSEKVARRSSSLARSAAANQPLNPAESRVRAAIAGQNLKGLHAYNFHSVLRRVPRYVRKSAG